MPKLEFEGKQFDIDEGGFLQDFDSWNNNLAFFIAKSQSIKQLTEEHWKVINYIRDYYKEFGIAPMVRKLCKDTGFDLKHMYKLFSSGPANGACKIAGLPKPTGCV